MKRRTLFTTIFILTLILLAVAGCQDEGDVSVPVVPENAAPDQPEGGAPIVPSPGTSSEGEGGVTLPPATAVAEAESTAVAPAAPSGGEGGEGATEPVEPAQEEPGEAPPQAETPTQEGATPLPEPQLVEPPAVSTIEAGATVSHQVQEGEWLLQIARCYGASYGAVRQANSLWNPNFIQPGMTITVPNVGSEGPILGPPCVVQVTVQPGDSWESLAQRYGTTVAVLQQANPGPLQPGRAIWAPVTGPGDGGAAAPMPARSHSLLFLHEGNLALWRQTDGRVEIFPDESAAILALVTHDEGRYALLRQTPDGGSTFEIALVDLEARTINVLESGLPMGGEESGPPALFLSPDGSWGVYVVRQEGGNEVTTFPTADPAASSGLGGIDHGLADYETVRLFAGPDDNHFLWFDRAGLFQLPYDLQGEAQQLVALGEENPSTPVLFDPVAWSPAGRYLLLQGYFIEGGAYFVFDSETAEVAQVPDSTGYVNVPAVSWQPDGSLLLLRPPELEESSNPVRTSYQVQEAGPGFTLLTSGAEAVPLAADPPMLEGPGYYIGAPAHQPEVPVMAVQGAAPALDGFWQLGGDSPQRLNSLPVPFFTRMIWAPEGSGLLLDVMGQGDAERSVVYVGQEGEPFSLADWLGRDIHDFHWIAP